MKTSILLLCLFISSASYAGPWNAADTKREAVYLTLHTMDWAQTREIARNPDKWHETNPYLGNHPSVARVNRYFVAMGITHIVIAHILPANYRRAFQYVTIGVEAGYVVHNFSMGLSLGF